MRKLALDKISATETGEERDLREMAGIAPLNTPPLSKFTTTNDAFSDASNYSSIPDNIVKQPHYNKHDVQASYSSSVAVGDTFEPHSHREPHHLMVVLQSEGLQHSQEVNHLVSRPVNNHSFLQQPQYPLVEPSLDNWANGQAVKACNSNASIPDWRFDNHVNPWIPAYLGIVGPALVPNAPAFSPAAPMIPAPPMPQYPSIPSPGAFFPPKHHLASPTVLHAPSAWQPSLAPTISSVMCSPSTWTSGTTAPGLAAPTTKGRVTAALRN